jgi:hypothetical protein
MWYVCGVSQQDVGVRMSKSGTVKQIFQLIWERKAWWLVPMVVVFLLVGLLIVTTAGNPLSPFIYALF